MKKRKKAKAIKSKSGLSSKMKDKNLRWLPTDTTRAITMPDKTKLQDKKKARGRSHKEVERAHDDDG